MELFLLKFRICSKLAKDSLEKLLKSDFDIENVDTHLGNFLNVKDRDQDENEVAGVSFILSFYFYREISLY